MQLSKLISIVLIVFCLHPLAKGQSSRTYRPSWGIKLNPLAIVAHTHGIELGLEHTINNNASIHLGGSYLNDFGIFPDKNFEGYKLTGEYRQYHVFKRKHPNTFLAFQVYFKKTFAQGQTYLDRANGNYQQLTKVEVMNTSLGFLGVYGKVLPLTSWLSLDLSVAIGVKRLSVTSDDIAPDAAFRLFNDNIFDLTVNSLGTGWYPLLQPQIKLNIELF